MPQPYVGETRMFAGNFPPAGWQFCEGQLLPIPDYETLFNLIGTTYGGDGASTFALPDLRGRVPISMGTATYGTAFQPAQFGGVEQVTLMLNQIPAHSHSLLASTSQETGSNPMNEVLADTGTMNLYGDDAPYMSLNPNAIQMVGGNQPHQNMQPYLCISFIISLFGIYPQQP